MRRARESDEHLTLKANIGSCLREQELIIAYEERRCDIAVYEPSSGYFYAIEVERSPRNFLANVARDLAHGCHGVIAVAATDSGLSALGHSYRKLRADQQRRVRLMLAVDLMTHLQVSRSDQPLTELF